MIGGMSVSYLLIVGFAALVVALAATTTLGWWPARSLPHARRPLLVLCGGALVIAVALAASRLGSPSGASAAVAARAGCQAARTCDGQSAPGSAGSAAPPTSGSVASHAPTRRAVSSRMPVTVAPARNGNPSTSPDTNKAAPAVGSAARPTAQRLAAGKSSSAVVIVAAGDIAGPGPGDSATAALIAKINPAAVLTLGDLCYPASTSACFRQYYGPTWGAFRARTKPALGNHDAGTGIGAYRSYWGFSSSSPLYYSYDLGGWHIVALNSEAPHTAGSAQVAWLKADLAAHTAACTLAYWHKPRFSSGSTHGSDASFTPFWQALYAAHAEIVLSGHDHDYERFAPQTPSGASAADGIRQFVVGTGGRSYYQLGRAKSNSQVRAAGTFGVLQLTLRTGGYDFRFVPQAGGGFSDSGSGTCH